MVRLYLPLFVRGLVSYLRYMCLIQYCGVQHILCCVFVLFFFVLCTICCQFLWIARFWLPLRYSLTFIQNIQYNDVKMCAVHQHFFVSEYRIYFCDVYVPITNQLPVHILIYYLSCSIINLANNKRYTAFLLYSTYIYIDMNMFNGVVDSLRLVVGVCY